MADKPPVVPILGAAATAFLLLLIAPWTPPILALMGFVAVLVMGVTIFYMVGFASQLAYDAADRALPEIPDEAEDQVGEQVRTAYMNGEISEAEFEERIEDAIREE